MEKIFQLVKGSKASDCHVARLNALKKVTLTKKNSQFERRRDVKEISEEIVDEDLEKNKESKKMARKTKAVHNVNKEEMLLRAKESRKWVLSVIEEDLGRCDYDGQLLNHEMSHCLFILGSDGFKVVPTDSLYQFNPKRQSKLTLDEAEKLIQEKQQEIKKQSQLEENAEKKELKVVDKGGQHIKMTGSDDELDYDIGEEFADDEEGLVQLEDDLEVEKQKKDMKKLRQSEEESSEEEPLLNQSGKELQKLLKDKNVDVADESSDSNPYKSQSDSDIEEEDDIINSQFSQEIKGAINQNKKRMHPGEPDLNLMTKRPKSESQYAQPLPTPKMPVQGQLLTEKEVVDIIKANPEISTKDFLKKLKQRIKSHSSNRDLLRDILKKVAIIKDGKIHLK